MSAHEWSEYLMFVRLRRWDRIQVTGEWGCYFPPRSEWHWKNPRSNLGTFPWESICWRSFSVTHTLALLLTVVHALLHTHSVSIEDVLGQSRSFNLLSRFIIDMSSPPDFHSLSRVSFRFSRRGQRTCFLAPVIRESQGQGFNLQICIMWKVSRFKKKDYSPTGLIDQSLSHSSTPDTLWFHVSLMWESSAFLCFIIILNSASCDFGLGRLDNFLTLNKSIKTKACCTTLLLYIMFELPTVCPNKGYYSQQHNWRFHPGNIVMGIFLPPFFDIS